MGKLRSRIKARLRKWLRTLCGIPDLEEDIESMYYFINNGLDITNFPKAKGELRKYQLADTELLRLFHEVCQNNKLTYWLDWGTLLGAVRHNGFIPWDDDLDVCMPREDYNKAKGIIAEEFTKLGFRTVVKRAIYIWNEENGVALDIFAVDQTEFDGNMPALERRAKEFLSVCSREYEANRWAVLDGLDEKREKLMSGATGECIYYSALESAGKLYIHKPEEIFPLQKHSFEQYEFWVPNNCEAYLETEYPGFMSFPRRGILHHHKENDAIYMRAANKQISLEEYANSLSDIHFLGK